MGGAIQLDNGNPDGVILGQSGNKVGFYGTTPVAIQTATTAIAGASTTTSTKAAINSIITNAAAYGLDL